MIESIVSSSLLIAAIIGIRFIFSGKISRRFQYTLWVIVLIRLCLPFTLLPSAFSIMNVLHAGEEFHELQINLAEGLPLKIGDGDIPPIAANTIDEASFEENSDYNKKSFDYKDTLMIIWPTGAVIVFLWFAGTSLVFYLGLRKMRRPIKKETFPCGLSILKKCKLPIYIADDLASPCLFGLLRPAVYLTSGAAAEKEIWEQVMVHELCHYRQGDHFWSVMLGLCLAVYWWNPFIWAAALLSKADGEYACDEAAIKILGPDKRIAYGKTVLSMISIKRNPMGIMYTATTMASGKKHIKKRIELIAKNTKIMASAIAMVILLVGLCIIVTFTGAKEKPPAAEEAAPMAPITIEEEAVRSQGEESDGDNKELDSYITEAVLKKAQNGDDGNLDSFTVESHSILKIVEEGNIVTVYAMVMDLSFQNSDNGPEEIGGSHMPAALTFEKKETGELSLLEYWIPEDGSYYASSIRDKFPEDIYEQALDTQTYVLLQIQECYGKAAALMKDSFDVNEKMEELITSITNTPSESSDPSAYIETNPSAYRELLYYGDDTLQYVFAEFLTGGQTDLKGHIMLAAMRELIGGEDMRAAVTGTAQEWFDVWKENALRLKEESDMETIEKSFPKAYILLKMMDEI